MRGVYIPGTIVLIIVIVVLVILLT